MVLSPKYKTEIKLDVKKIKDLQVLRGGLDVGGQWIDELAERQSKLDDSCAQNHDNENDNDIIEQDDEYLNNLDKILENEDVQRIK